MLVYCLLISWISDWIIEKEYMTRTNVRKLNATVGLLGGGTFVVIGSYVSCDKVLFFITSIFGCMLAANTFPGIKANALDLSPNYAGSVMAVSHGIAGLCGVFAPIVVGKLVPTETLSEWRLVFWIIFGVSVITNIIFVSFASGDVQEWNDPYFDRNKPKEMTTEEIMEAESLLLRKKIGIVAVEVMKNETENNE